MIIAVIILYIINVIFKFASLLIIVNGIQKYANLSNYHYVITTYDENGLAEKEECWFKDGVSKVVNTVYNNNEIIENLNISIDYKNEKGYIKNMLDNTIKAIDSEEYIYLYNEYREGGQFYTKLPIDIRNLKISNIFYKSIEWFGINIQIKDSLIILESRNNIIWLDKDMMLPTTTYRLDKKNNQILNERYFFEINCVDYLEV